MSSADLVAIADRLYAEPVAGFVPARDQAAKEATSKDSASKDLAARVKALRKPSVAAWAVNLLVRRESGQIEEVLELADALRAAAESLDGEELRTLTRQRRQLTAALTTAAARLAREHGVKLSVSVADQVEGMLTAAMLDPVAADVVRSGLVVTGFTSTGVSELDVPAVCAVPEALGHRAEPSAGVEPGPPALHVVPDDGIRLAAAQERVEEAVIEAATAREQVEHATARGEKLQARRLQLQGEIDELRRRLSGLEDDVEKVDEEIESAGEALEEAEEELAAADQELSEAREAVTRLR